MQLKEERITGTRCLPEWVVTEPTADKHPWIPKLLAKLGVKGPDMSGWSVHKLRGAKVYVLRVWWGHGWSHEDFFFSSEAECKLYIRKVYLENAREYLAVARKYNFCPFCEEEKFEDEPQCYSCGIFS